MRKRSGRSMFGKSFFNQVIEITKTTYSTSDWCLQMNRNLEQRINLHDGFDDRNRHISATQFGSRYHEPLRFMEAKKIRRAYYCT